MVPAHPSVLLKMSTPRRHRDPAYAASIAAEIYGGTMRTDPAKGVPAAARGDPVRARGAATTTSSAAMAGWSSLPFLRLLRQPTLVMGGTDDPIIPAVNPRMQARLIPRARLHLYDGGHLDIVTEAATLVPVVEQFLLEPDPDV